MIVIVIIIIAQMIIDMRTLVYVIIKSIITIIYNYTLFCIFLRLLTKINGISDPHQSLIFALIAFSPLWPDCEERSGSDLDQGDRRAIQYVVDLVQALSAGKPFRSRSW